jgi:hypothetical protein
MKILDSVWFDKIGIVKVDTGYETKWYIGIGKGNNKEIDEKIIMHAGMPIYPKMLKDFFKSVKEVQKEEELEAIRLEHLTHINKIINKQKDVDNNVTDN